MDLIKMGLRWDEVQPERRADLFKCALLRQPAWRHFMTCSEEREKEKERRNEREKLHRHASWRSQLCGRRSGETLRLAGARRGRHVGRCCGKAEVRQSPLLIRSSPPAPPHNREARGGERVRGRCGRSHLERLERGFGRTVKV